MPVIFKGDEKIAYRDPTCYYYNGEYHLFFTFSEKENGYMYHTVTLICEKCNASVYLNVLCQRQDFACMTLEECRTEIKWEEILCDMPYEILYD